MQNKEVELIIVVGGRNIGWLKTITCNEYPPGPDPDSDLGCE